MYSLMVATLWPKHVAAICNCYSTVVHWQAAVSLGLLCILEVQRGYHTLTISRGVLSAAEHNQCSHIDSYVEPRCAQLVFTYRQLCWAPMCTTSVSISTAMLSPDVHNQCSHIDSYVEPRCAQPVFTYRQLCWAPMCTTSVHISTVMFSPDVHNQCSHNSCTRLYEIFRTLLP